MTSPLCDVSDGFGDDVVVGYDFFSEIVNTIYWYVLIYTGCVILMNEFGLSLGGTVNATINLVVRIGRGLLSCKTCFLEVLLVRKVDATYTLRCCSWYIALRIAMTDKCLARSGPNRQVRASTSAIIWYGMRITVK